MRRKAALISLRFNPGFVQTLIGYAKALEELGVSVDFLVNPHYEQFKEAESAAPLISYRGGAAPKSWDIAIFLNPSVDNYRLGLQLKAGGAKILYLYHEPWQLSLAYVRNEGLRAAVRAAAAHRATTPVLRLADRILLPSKTALEAYRKIDGRHNPHAVYFPLIFEDSAPNSVADLLAQKRYFSFIGNPCRSHGFDHYIAAIRHGILAGDQTKFLIASRFPIPKAVLRDPLLQKHSDRIAIHCGRPLGEEEINRFFAASFCVWNLYRRSTQSGVLPKAFMFGTPVIAGQVGSFPEFVQDGWNGRFSDARDMESVWTAVRDMREDLPRFSRNCRSAFREVFYYRSNLNVLRNILGALWDASELA